VLHGHGRLGGGHNIQQEEPVNAWEQIEREARGLVQKSGGDLSPAQGVERLLDTPRGRELYAAYLAETGGAGSLVSAAAPQREQELASGREQLAASGYRVQKNEPQRLSQGSRADVAWAVIEKMAGSRVEKSAGRLSTAQAVCEVLKSDIGRRAYAEYLGGMAEAIVATDPGGTFAQLAGGPSRTAIAKALSVEGTIDEKARALQERRPELSLERCVSLVLQENPDLYTIYMNAKRGGAGSGKTATAIESPDAARGRVRKGELSAIRKQVGDVVQLWIDTPGAGPLADWLGMSDAERVQKANGAPNGVPVEKAGDDDVDRWLDELFGP
jgi:hypothetical protein